MNRELWKEWKYAINAIGLRLFEFNFGQPNIASHEEVKKYLTEATCKLGEKQYNINFLMKEWENVVDAWQLHSWEEYRDVTRLGRKTRLSEKQRDKLWRVFAYTKSKLNDQCLITYSDMFSQLSSRFSQIEHPPFDFVVVDEAQDLSVSQLRFLSVLGKDALIAFSSLVILANVSFNSRFPGKRLVLISEGDSKTCELIIVHPIRLERRQIDCCRQKYPMLMVLQKNEKELYQYSTAQNQLLWFWIILILKLKQ